jgi:hypothetical protein
LKFEIPSMGRAKISLSSNGLQIVVPAVFSVILTFFLSAWLVGWAKGEIFAVQSLVDPKLPTTGFIFILAWLCVWTFFGVAVAIVGLWGAFGREVIELNLTSLEVRKEILGYGYNKKFDVAHISNLRVRPHGWGFRPMPFQMPFGSGTVAFDYGKATKTFGLWLDAPEAVDVIQAMKKQVKSLGKST